MNRIIRKNFAVWAMVGCSLAGGYWYFSTTETHPEPGAKTAPPLNAIAASTPSTPHSAFPHWEAPRMTEGTPREEWLETARRLVALDSTRTLDWALTLDDPLLRDRARSSVLQAWGELDPESAVAWALEQDEDQRFMSLEAALDGAATQPEAAECILRIVLTDDPECSNQCAAMLIGSLSRAGDFQSALNFMQYIPEDSRPDQVASIFRSWSRTRPESAVEALDAITDPDICSAAFAALTDGWSENNPSALAAYAERMPSGMDRNMAMIKALDNWSLQDPAALADWLSEHPDLPEYDFGATILLIKSDGANRDIPTALHWAGNIRNDEFRLTALDRIIKEWVASNPLKAENYVQESPALTPAERQALLQSIAAHNRGD